MQNASPYTTASDKAPGIEDSMSWSAKTLIFGFAFTALFALPSQQVMPNTVKSIAASLCALLALLLWAFQIRKSGKAVLWDKYLCIPLGLSLYALASALWAPQHTALIEAARWLVIGIIFFVGVNTLHREFFPTLAKVIHWTALALSLLALVQFWLDLGWFPAEAAPGATFGNRNYFAEFAATCLPFSFWLFLQSKTFRASILHGCGLAFILAALMSTGARAPLLAALFFLLSFLVLLASHRARIFKAMPTRIFVAGMGATVALVLALGCIPSLNEKILAENRGQTPIERSFSRLNSLGERNTYDPESSFGMRLISWKATQKMVEAHPLAGVGAGAWNYTIPLYLPNAMASDGTWHAHNEPLQLVAEFGLLGWASLAGLLYLTLTLAWKALRRLRSPDMQQAEHALRELTILLSLASLGIVSLSGLPWHAAATCYALGLLLAMLLVEHGHSPRLSIAGAAIFGKIALPVTAIALLIACVTAVQALRSEYYFYRGTGMILALSAHKATSKTPQPQLHAQAISDIQYGLSIYSDHDIYIDSLNSNLRNLGDFKSLIHFNEYNLKYRPHAADVQCNHAAAYADNKDYSEAKKIIENIRKSQPKAKCLAFSEFVVAYRSGNFGESLSLGQSIIDDSFHGMNKDFERFVVDATYRSALQETNLDAALSALKIRANKWPELRASSLLLQARVIAIRAPDQVSDEALKILKEASAIAPRQDYLKAVANLPVHYQKALQPPQ
jgi:O-antigen ligase